MPMGLSVLCCKPMCKLDLTFACCLARSRGTKQVQVLASQYLVCGDPQTEPFNEEPRWHVPHYCALVTILKRTRCCARSMRAFANEI